MRLSSASAEQSRPNSIQSSRVQRFLKRSSPAYGETISLKRMCGPIYTKSSSIRPTKLRSVFLRPLILRRSVPNLNCIQQSELIGVGVIDANPAAYSMYEKTYPELENLQKTIASKVNDLGGKVDILMYFDEAQELMKAEDSPQDRAYRTLRSVLNDYGDCPLFTIFLSTVPHIAEYVAPVITTRVYGHKLGEPKAPITGTPFDCAPDILVAEYAHDREEIAQPHFMARFGRPL